MHDCVRVCVQGLPAWVESVTGIPEMISLFVMFGAGLVSFAFALLGLAGYLASKQKKD